MNVQHVISAEIKLSNGGTYHNISVSIRMFIVTLEYKRGIVYIFISWNGIAYTATFVVTLNLAHCYRAHWHVVVTRGFPYYKAKCVVGEGRRTLALSLTRI